ncbi:Uncharacterised protein [Mycobacteroides abscessus subsp. abscessus]|nr:Uncharacterised protein [Mycobacteroides abscessus subsp. abscessus]
MLVSLPRALRAAPDCCRLTFALATAISNLEREVTCCTGSFETVPSSVASREPSMR